MDTALRFDSVSKFFTGKAALDAVSFDTRCGETVGLVGANGAGKTTLIRGLLDLNRIDAGSIEIFGRAHTERGARQRVAYLAERFAPPYFATGKELLHYVAGLHGARYVHADACTQAEALGLDPAALERPVREYSKGMAQKLGLMSCILPGCDLLVLDEPMSGLDPRARALFVARLEALKTAGASLFFSTHLLTDVANLCDRLVVLHEGRVCFAGAPRALIEDYGSGAAEVTPQALEAAYLNLTNPDP